MHNPKTVIFLHIPKNGGSTLWSLMRRMYGKKRVRRFAGPPLPERTHCVSTIMQTGELDGMRVFGAHFMLIPEQTARYRHFTMLRDPISRTVSKYYFTRSKPDYPLHDLFHRVSLEKSIPHMRDNEQVRYLANVTADHPVTRDHLEQAKYNLEHRITVFGLMERYDESLILFRRTFGWPMPYYLIKNRSKNRPKTISPEVQRIAAEYNSFDMELYAWAQTLFEQRIAAQPLDFQREVTRFQRTLLLWMRWHEVRQRPALHRIEMLLRRVIGKVRFEIGKRRSNHE